MFLLLSSPVRYSLFEASSNDEGLPERSVQNA
jgi:hypothetical protein